MVQNESHNYSNSSWPRRARTWTEEKGAFTQKVVVGVIVVIIILDILFLVSEIGSFSETLREYAYRDLFAISWIWGVLGSHLFIVRDGDAPVKEITGIWILVSITALLVIVGLTTDFDGWVDIYYVHVVLLVIGLIAGFVLWPQKPPLPDTHMSK